MRERQQMASRPFASVAVALDARGEQTELLQPVMDVSAALLAYIHTHTYADYLLYHIHAITSCRVFLADAQEP